MRFWQMNVRESFWFLPALLGMTAIVLAIALVELDHVLVDADFSAVPLVKDLSATGGRAILSVIGGTMLGVAATSFSITISVLATTSSAYGPRLVRNFMADRGNQFVLAVLTSTFLYSLIVLRAVQSEADSSVSFVPVIAVSFAVVLAVGDVAVLVYFIHHIATSVQIATLQKRVLMDFENVIDLIYPIDYDPETETVEKVLPTGTGLQIRSTKTGYIGRIDFEALTHSGRSTGTQYRVRACPGDYVLTGDVLVESEQNGTSKQERAVRDAFTITAERTPHQDLRFAVQQLTEMGVRGLASGSNDPYTAIGAIDAISGGLATLCRRPGPVSHYRDADGVRRVTCDWPSPAELVADVYSAIRTYGLLHPLVIEAIIRMTLRLEQVADGETRRTLHDEVRAVTAAYGAVEPVSVESPALTDRLNHVATRLNQARTP